MTKPIRANYDKAAEHIRSGYWTVDVEHGIVIGPYGKPFARRNTDGYVQIKFRDPSSPGRDVAVLAHRVIFEHVYGALSEDLTVNHRNGDKLDNRPSNLEPLTQADNVKHAVKNGLYHANCWYCRHNGRRHTKAA